MTDLTSIAHRAFAAFGAVALTITLLVSSFATPQASSVVGIMV